MTHQIFNLPPQQPLTAAGRVLPGSKLYFYLTGTTTPTPVYTTSALSVAHSQPLIADAGGRFSTVYLDPTIAYKATVTDANDVLLYTVDPVNDQLLSQALIGEYLFPQTAAESSAAVTPSNFAYPPGDLRRYGLSADGTTGGASAWADADAQSAGGGVPVFVPRISGGVLTATALTSSHLSDIVFEPGARVIYTGSSNEAALTIGTSSSSDVCFTRRYERLWVERQSISDWTNEASIGIRFFNAAGCYISVAQINGFTIGFRAIPSNGAGFQGNEIHFGQIYNCKIGRDWNNATGGFCNDNSIYAGRIEAFSSVDALGARYGDRITSSDSVYVDNNGNRFYGTLTELNASGTSSEAVAVLVEHGEENFWHNMRSEFNDLTMRCSNASQRNEIWLGYSDDSTTKLEQLNTASQNIVIGMRDRPKTHYAYPLYYFPDLGRKARGTSGTSVLVEGLMWGTSGSATRTATSSTSVTYDGNYITIPSTRCMGIYINTGTVKEFVVRRSGTAGGRVMIAAHDAADGGGSLISTTGAVLGTQDTTLTYDGSLFGGVWRTGSDSLNDVYFRVSSATLSVFILVAGSTASAVLSSFGVYTRTLEEGCRVFTGAYTTPGEITGGAYTVTNVTTDRSYDADTVAVAELADIVGTLIADLKTLRILR